MSSANDAVRAPVHAREVGMCLVEVERNLSRHFRFAACHLRFRELEAEISASNLYDDPRKARETLREHTRLKELLANWEQLKKARTDPVRFS